MSLFASKREAFLNAMKGRSGDAPCPICGGRNFDMGDYSAILYMSQEMSEIDATDLGTYIPCAARVCTKCGHVDLFALYAYGMNN